MKPDDILKTILGNDYRADATAAFTNELSQIKSTVYRKKYDRVKYTELVPISTEIDKGADKFRYILWDMAGAAKVLANYADDLPSVDVFGTEHEQDITGLAVKYGYSVQDVRAALFANRPLSAEKGIAARRAHENKFDEVAALGVPAKGIPGLLNNSNVNLVSALTGTWSTATAAQIVADLAELCLQTNAAVNHTWMVDTVVCSIGQYTLLNSKKVGTDLRKTAMQEAIDTIPGLNRIVPWHHANLADAAGTGPRLAAYPMDPEVMQLEMPQPFEQFPAQVTGMMTEIPTHSRVGGVSLRYPIAVGYMDGC